MNAKSSPVSVISFDDFARGINRNYRDLLLRHYMRLRAADVGHASALGETLALVDDLLQVSKALDKVPIKLSLEGGHDDLPRVAPGEPTVSLSEARAAAYPESAEYDRAAPGAL